MYGLYLLSNLLSYYHVLGGYDYYLRIPLSNFKWKYLSNQILFKI